MTRTKQKARRGLGKRAEAERLAKSGIDQPGKDEAQKRKREETEQEEASNDRPPKTQKQKQTHDATSSASTKYTVNESLSKMDPTLLADHFAQTTKKHIGATSTAVELDDKAFPARYVLDTTSFPDLHSTANLPAFLETFSPGGKDALSVSSETNGTPHTLVITASGLRAAELARTLRVFKTESSAVGKLFAKHIKIEEARSFLEGTRVGVGVGTPERCKALVESGHLRVEELKKLVVDGSCVDQKKRSIFDIKEVFVPLLELLAVKEIRARLEDEAGMEILVF